MDFLSLLPDRISVTGITGADAIVWTQDRAVLATRIGSAVAKAAGEISGCPCPPGRSAQHKARTPTLCAATPDKMARAPGRQTAAQPVPAGEWT